MSKKKENKPEEQDEKDLEKNSEELTEQEGKPEAAEMQTGKMTAQPRN